MSEQNLYFSLTCLKKLCILFEKKNIASSIRIDYKTHNNYAFIRENVIGIGRANCFIHLILNWGGWDEATQIQHEAIQWILDQ